jgi:hypothetical protein
VVELTAIKPPVDKERRRAFIGSYKPVMTDEQLEEALRPMTDEEADAFVEGRY